jgi:SAM-dependent methyltransferase
MLKINNLKRFLYLIINKRGLKNYLSNFADSQIKILDVGCGNNSAMKIKKIIPNCYYVGLDIKNYSSLTNNKKYVDKLVLTKPNLFHKAILDIGLKFDIIISSHNLEHCDNREATLEGIHKALKKGGYLYMSFPCEKSTTFPQRKGTLNYFTDPTHKNNPPNFNMVISFLKKNGIKINYCTSSYRPFLRFIIGFLLEPISIITGKVFSSTWAFYGFEAIIHGEKK